MGRIFTFDILARNMASNCDGESETFTFIWLVENISYLPLNISNRLVSVPFFAIEINKWRLFLKVRKNGDGDLTDLYLGLRGTTHIVRLDCELSILNADGCVLIRKQVTEGSSKGGRYMDFVALNAVFGKERGVSMPNDSIILRCRMRKGEGGISESGRCFARSRLEMERTSFVWSIAGYSTLRLNCIKSVPIRTASFERPVGQLCLFLKEGQDSQEKLVIEVVSANLYAPLDVTSGEDKVEFSTCRLTLLDATGGETKSVQYDFHRYKTEHESWTFPLLSLGELTDRAAHYLPNDTLSLKCQFEFYKGDVLRRIEYTVYEPDGVLTRGDELKFSAELANSSTGLKDDLRFLYEDRHLCDVNLRTGAETFPAHKAILGARSPVFRDMFRGGMKENVDVSDLDNETVRRILLYLYTDTMEDLQWGVVSQLYKAADKYQILTLKNKCRFILETNLHPNNACGILVLADMLHDSNLKTSVQDYILRYEKQIILTDSWKTLMKNNHKLAAETMYLKFLRK